MLEAGLLHRFVGSVGHLIPRPEYARFKNRNVGAEGEREVSPSPPLCVITKPHIERFPQLIQSLLGTAVSVAVGQGQNYPRFTGRRRGLREGLSWLGPFPDLILYVRAHVNHPCEEGQGQGQRDFYS